MNKFKKIISSISKTIVILILPMQINAQQDGYWDKERITNKQIVVSAREKVVIKSEDFPVGTTEIVYRITLLNENQEMASSLVSVLKSIPDPSGISQGSAGAVLLLSKLSGDDKCKYAIFQQENNATNYKKTGNLDKACLYQNNPINKEAKVLSLGKSTCLTIKTQNIFFGFESKNLIMNQKIILEIVPWVDNKLSRGWNLQNKKAILNELKSSETSKKLKNSDDFCVCQLEKLQEKFKFFEFENLLLAEKKSNLKSIESDCLKKTGDNQLIDDSIREEIDVLIKSENYDLAIIKLQNIIKKGNSNAIDFNNLGTCLLLTKQYQKALVNIKKAEILEPSELQIQLNLAHAFMLNKDLKSAKKIHEKFKNQNLNATQNWIEKAKIDLELFQKNGISNDDFKKILKIFE
jgi:tetratricopeptide (TPR) repeat protein